MCLQAFIPPDEQRLIAGTRELLDDERLVDAGISAWSTLRMCVPRPPYPKYYILHAPTRELQEIA